MKCIIGWVLMLWLPVSLILMVVYFAIRSTIDEYGWRGAIGRILGWCIGIGVVIGTFLYGSFLAYNCGR